jgi:hypothetical protein
VCRLASFSGINGNGKCTCNSGYYGKACIDPVITGVSPYNGQPSSQFNLKLEFDCPCSPFVWLVGSD